MLTDSRLDLRLSTSRALRLIRSITWALVIAAAGAAAGVGGARLPAAPIRQPGTARPTESARRAKEAGWASFMEHSLRSDGRPARKRRLLGGSILGEGVRDWRAEGN